MQISRMHGSMQVSGMHGTHLMPFLSASELSARFYTVQNSANFYDEGAQCKGIYSAHILQGAQKAEGCKTSNEGSSQVHFVQCKAILVHGSTLCDGK